MVGDRRGAETPRSTAGVLGIPEPNVVLLKRRKELLFQYLTEVSGAVSQSARRQVSYLARTRPRGRGGRRGGKPWGSPGLWSPPGCGFGRGRHRGAARLSFTATRPRGSERRRPAVTRG